jgi:hypothetical protein
MFTVFWYEKSSISHHAIQSVGIARTALVKQDDIPVSSRFPEDLNDTFNIGCCGFPRPPLQYEERLSRLPRF